MGAQGCTGEVFVDLRSECLLVEVGCLGSGSGYGGRRRADTTYNGASVNGVTGECVGL